MDGFTFVNKTVLTISGTITADYSDINATVINKPEGVLDLSYALKPTDNYTAELYYDLTMPSEDENASTPGIGAQFTLKQDGNKILCSVGNQHVYIEETEDDYLTYVYNGSRWMEQYVDVEELNQIVEYPEFGYTEEFFEYADGYYFGKTYKMNMALDEYFEEIEQQFVDLIKQEYKAEIKKIETETGNKIKEYYASYSKTHAEKTLKAPKKKDAIKGKKARPSKHGGKPTEGANKGKSFKNVKASKTRTFKKSTSKNYSAIKTNAKQKAKGRYTKRG